MGNVLLILIALTAAMAVWGVAQLVMSLLNPDRRRLKKRLAGDFRRDSSALVNRPLVVDRQIKGLPPLLARLALIQSINQKLLYAYPEVRISRFLLLSGSLGLTFWVLLILAMDSLIAGTIGLAAGLYLPMIILNSKRGSRQRQLALQLPEALDFLSRVLRAGHSLSTGLQMMGDELPQPIGAEFRRCYDQHSLGHALEDSLRDMSARVDSSDFAFFVTAVLIQRQTGGDLSEVLANISQMVRSRIRLGQHVKAITAEGRFTGYILVAFPAVLFVVSYVLNPGYAGVLVNTETGKMLLGAAFGLQMLGLVAIRKIVTVRV